MANGPVDCAVGVGDAVDQVLHAAATSTMPANRAASGPALLENMPDLPPPRSNVDSDGRSIFRQSPPPWPIARAMRRACSRYALSNSARDRSSPTTEARLITGGTSPRFTRSSATRTLIELTMATAAMVDPGPTGVSNPSIIDKASAGGVHKSTTRSASSSRRPPADGSGSPDIDWATDVTAITRRPRFLAPRAISIGTAVSPLAEKTIIRSCGPNAKLDRITSARPGTR